MIPYPIDETRSLNPTDFPNQGAIDSAISMGFPHLRWNCHHLSFLKLTVVIKQLRRQGYQVKLIPSQQVVKDCWGYKGLITYPRQLEISWR